MTGASWRTPAPGTGSAGWLGAPMWSIVGREYQGRAMHEVQVSPNLRQQEGELAGGAGGDAVVGAFVLAGLVDVVPHGFEIARYAARAQDVHHPLTGPVVERCVHGHDTGQLRVMLGQPQCQRPSHGEAGGEDAVRPLAEPTVGLLHVRRPIGPAGFLQAPHGTSRVRSARAAPR